MQGCAQLGIGHVSSWAFAGRFHGARACAGASRPTMYSARPGTGGTACCVAWGQRETRAADAKFWSSGNQGTPRGCQPSYRSTFALALDAASPARACKFWFRGFALVEIDPLLAFQMIVNVDRSAHHQTTLGTPPRLIDLLNVCLPTNPPVEHFQVQQQNNALIIKARDLNLRMQEVGRVQDQFAGVIFGPALPLAQVTKFNGRFYLSDGFHRAYCLRQAGATHIPCVLREVFDPSEVGINNATFGDRCLNRSRRRPWGTLPRAEPMKLCCARLPELFM